MNEIQQDIADAVRRHYFWWPNHSSIGSEAHCQCGQRPRDWSHWADHIAEVLTSALGLTEFTCDGERWWSTKIEPITT
ncbi:hypothetical protein [Mycobacterium intracellulare]|uniref:hypothetical protein n=1 Tax=Mycobacterium intracellulare TaxID=1767 RepID=UPI00080BE1C1|nr:hypothetical protein [Mycobacterium intracellulare]OCB15096.1 hypothetical protein A5689_26950 [Mycobacterium intracellulare subsp. yongonense]